MVRINLSEITIILGRKNEGKSVLIEALMQEMDCFICFDPLNDHAIPDATPVTSPKELKQEIKNGTNKIIVRDKPLKKDKMENYLDVLEWGINVDLVTNCYIVVDEFNFYSNAHGSLDVFEDLAQFYVSHNNLGFVIGLRQAKDVYTDIFTQFDNMGIFHYGEFEDSKFSELDLPRYIVHLIQGKDVLFNQEGEIIKVSPHIDNNVVSHNQHVVRGLENRSYRFVWISVNETKPIIHDPVDVPPHMV